LEFYNPARDPDNAAFAHDGTGRATGTDFPAVTWFGGGDDILFEDCFFRFNAQAIGSAPGSATAGPTRFTIRRCIITDCYAIGGHSQGVYLDSLDGALIEENIFDHNSWNDQAGVPADIYNHHLYVYNLTNSTVRANMFLRDGSLQTKFVSRDLNKARNITIDNNLYLEGEVGISVAYQGGSSPGTPSGGSCTNGLSITNNVLLQINRDNPTGRDLGWGVSLKSVANVEVSGNIFSDFSFTPTGNIYALALDSGGETTSTSSNVTIENNTLYRIKDRGIMVSSLTSWSNIQIRNNTIQDGGLGAAMQSQSGTFVPLTYSGNVYSASSAARFALVGNVQQTYGQWIAASGETGSTARAVTYPNPGLNLDTYMAQFSLTLADLYAAVRKQSKANWNPAYTATTINDYIRGGFGISPVGPRH
jgi:antitoxin component HigA of HigAB toxin-antitoxin module